MVDLPTIYKLAQVSNRCSELTTNNKYYFLDKLNMIEVISLDTTNKDYTIVCKCNKCKNNTDSFRHIKSLIDWITPYVFVCNHCNYFSAICQHRRRYSKLLHVISRRIACMKQEQMKDYEKYLLKFSDTNRYSIYRIDQTSMGFMAPYQMTNFNTDINNSNIVSSQAEIIYENTNQLEYYLTDINLSFDSSLNSTWRCDECLSDRMYDDLIIDCLTI